MTAIIRPIGPLNKYIAEKKQVVVDSGITIRQALLNIGIPPEIVALVLVNKQNQNKDYLLQDQDEVQVIAVLGGG
jgi:sulfur carrier protein ThiS